MNYLSMNLDDIKRLLETDPDKPLTFAVPLKESGNPFHVGDIVGIREPFRRLLDQNGILGGIVYRIDNTELCWCSDTSEVSRWSPARITPDWVVRTNVKIVSMKETTLQNFSDADYAAMELDYAFQNNPQLILEEYLPFKNFEILKNWWKRHYSSTLKTTNNPPVILLSLVKCNSTDKKQ